MLLFLCAHTFLKYYALKPTANCIKYKQKCHICCIRWITHFSRLTFNSTRQHRILLQRTNYTLFKGDIFVLSFSKHRRVRRTSDAPPQLPTTAVPLRLPAVTSQLILRKSSGGKAFFCFMGARVHAVNCTEISFLVLKLSVFLDFSKLLPRVCWVLFLLWLMGKLDVTLFHLKCKSVFSIFSLSFYFLC